VTVVDLPRRLPELGRSADIPSVCRVGESTTVWAAMWTVIDPPPFVGRPRWL